MSSIMTNSAAMNALQTLHGINKHMETTQSRISSGLRVSTAADNAAYWSIATTMRSDSAALGAVKDSLGLGKAIVDVAYTTLNSAIDVTNEIKTKLVAAQTPGVDRSKIQSEITQLQNQLRSTTEAAVFNGENWLQTDSTTANLTKSIVASFSRASGVVTVGKIDIDTTNIMLFDTNAANAGVLDKDRTLGGTTISVENIDVSALTDTAADLTTLQELVGIVDAAVADMTSAATDLGAVKTRVGMQNDFISDLMNVIKQGVGGLVDANMEEESTRLQALQVQQQLGVQALSIANSNSQNILSLFRG